MPYQDTGSANDQCVILLSTLRGLGISSFILLGLQFVILP
jgi:hypothetical protein